MFEDNTFENILERMLENVPDDIDKREGSIIYNALAPVAAELTDMYITDEGILQEAFADTATREYLILRAKEQGIYINSATFAYYKGEFNTAIPIGARFIANGLSFIVVEPIDETNYIYKLQCETAGCEGNDSIGEIVATNNIKALTKAELTELLIPGEDTETTEDFRQRYFDKVNKNAFGGNRADYIAKVKEIAGVGEVKVTRTPKGGGTVEVIITDSDNNGASEELIKTVKAILDPEEHEGFGFGVVPIGHIVTVKSAVSKNVDIALTITSAGNIKAEDVKSKITEYIKSVNANWENESLLKIYAAQVIAAVLSISGVVNVTDVTLNGSDDILAAKGNEIFKVNDITIN